MSGVFWVAAVLAVLGVALFAVGFILFANGTGAAPRRRTEEDPTGVKRAGARVKWSDVFRRMPSSVGVLLDKDAERGQQLAGLGSLFVLAAVLAGLGAILALIAGLVS